MIKPAKITLILFSLLAVGFLVILAVNNSPPQLVIPVESLQPLETERPNRHPFTVAHRGASLNAPGNTLVAIERAVNLGFDYIEIDVRYTSDDIPVLLHNQTVDEATNGTGAVNSMSYAELQALDAGSWHSEEFAGIRVPALEDALKLMQGKICVIWDAKDLPRKSALDLFHQYGFTSGCLVISLPHIYPDAFEASVHAINKLWLNPPLSMPIKDVNSLSEMLEKYPGIRFLHVRGKFATPELVEAAHSAGLLLYTRTVENMDNANFYRQSLDAGVDGLMLKDIENLRQFLQEEQEPYEIEP